MENQINVSDMFLQQTAFKLCKSTLKGNKQAEIGKIGLGSRKSVIVA